MRAKMSVLGRIMSFSPYPRCAMVQFPFNHRLVVKHIVKITHNSTSIIIIILNEFSHLKVQLNTLDLSVSFVYLGPWMPWTFRYLLDTLDIEVPFGYILS